MTQSQKAAPHPPLMEILFKTHYQPATQLKRLQGVGLRLPSAFESYCLYFIRLKSMIQYCMNKEWGQHDSFKAGLHCCMIEKLYTCRTRRPLRSHQSRQDPLQKYNLSISEHPP